MKSSVRKSRLSFLAVLLAVTLLRPLPAPAAAQTSTDVELERFFDSDYTWCDVQLLAAYWEQDWMDTKARIGRKIGWGDEAILEDFLGGARGQAAARGDRCAFHESEFTYEDAELLSTVWQMPIDEVKTVVENKLFAGESGVVRSTLAEARGGRVAPATGDPVDAFFAKGFTYCDARLIAASWGEETYEAKLQIGEKVLAENLEGVWASFATAREELESGAFGDFSCSYVDEGYTYDDMVDLARYWQMTVDETKTAVENKLLWGLDAETRAALTQIRG